MRVRRSSAMRSAVPLGRSRAIFATNTLAGTGASASGKLGGAHRKIRASSRGASSHVTLVAGAAARGAFAAGLDCADASRILQGIRVISREMRGTRIMVLTPQRDLELASRSRTDYQWER